MFEELLTATHTRAEHELSDQMRSQRQTIKAALAALRSLGTVIPGDTVGNDALRPQLFVAVPRDVLEAQVAGLTEWVIGTKSDVFHGLVGRLGHLRSPSRRPRGPGMGIETVAFTGSGTTDEVAAPLGRLRARRWRR
jgi:hypothetical protein